MYILAIVFAFIAGICTALEHTINGRLGEKITPSAATLFSLLIGTAVILLVLILRGNFLKNFRLGHINPILFLGGVLGAMIIYLSSKAIPSLGVTRTLILIIAGQLACGLMIDLFYYKMAFDAAKWIGVILVLSGTYLML